MAINDPNYRYATQTWEADGVRTDYEISFDGGYIRQSDVVAFSVAIDPDTGLPSGRVVHPLTFLSETIDPDDGSIASAQVRISPAVATGRRVVIFRSTQKEKSLLNYQNGSILTEKNLDLANAQAIFGIAEIMDGLNDANVAIGESVTEIIDISELVRNIYNEVLILLESGGIVSVAPMVWQWTSDGEVLDMPIPEATIDKASFYDVYFETAPNSGDFTALRPDDDYAIVLDPEDYGLTAIRLAATQADGTRGFAVLRGFARPYTGETPITTTAMGVVTGITNDYVAGSERHNTLLVVDASTDINIRLYPTDLTTRAWQRGQYFSVMQRGTGKVTVIMDSGSGTLTPAPGFVAQTRGQGSIISGTCLVTGANQWALSGDLLRTTVSSDPIAIRMIDRSVLSTTNATTGTLKDEYVMPHGMVLDSIANLGFLGKLLVAQSAGTLLSVDVLRNGVSIFTVKPTFDNSELTTATAATQPTYAVGGDVLYKNDVITLSILTVGTALAKGLTVYLRGQRSS